MLHQATAIDDFTQGEMHKKAPRYLYFIYNPPHRHRHPHRLLYYESTQMYSFSVPQKATLPCGAPRYHIGVDIVEEIITAL